MGLRFGVGVGCPLELRFGAGVAVRSWSWLFGLGRRAWSRVGSILGFGFRFGSRSGWGCVSRLGVRFGLFAGVIKPRAHSRPAQ